MSSINSTLRSPQHIYTLHTESNEEEPSSSSTQAKPILARPRPLASCFTLLKNLDKLSINSMGASAIYTKDEINGINDTLTRTRVEQTKKMEEILKKEASLKNWTTFTKVTSWIGSCMSMATGLALVLSGVGCVAGAMMIIGGALTISNEVMEIAGGWQKVAEILPTEDPQEKQAVITWMQLGITAVSLITSGVGIIFGGFHAVSDASKIMMTIVGGVASVAYGVGALGKGVTGYHHKHSLADLTAIQMLSTQLKYHRDDLIRSLEMSAEMITKHYVNLAQTLKQERAISRFLMQKL